MANSGSDLPNATDIVRKMNDSAEAFRAATPDYNASLNNARVALETLDRSEVDDAALARWDHGMLGSRLRQQKRRREIERDDLVPSLARMILGRRAPCRASIVHKDIEPSMARQAPPTA